MLLDDYLERCCKAYKHNSLDGMDSLESALQELLQSQVGSQLTNKAMWNKCECVFVSLVCVYVRVRCSTV